MGLSLIRSPCRFLPSDPSPKWSYKGFGPFRRGLATHTGVDTMTTRRDSNCDTIHSPLR